MRILVSNDDGILAPGIRVLAKILSEIAHVEVMAPDRNRSGASNSLTLSRPLIVRKLEDHFYSVEGTPTDCVHLALTGFFNDPFDMVISGVNEGSNLGDDVLYSGTVAAAMEGRSLGLSSIAVSLSGHVHQHFETAAIVARDLALKLVEKPLVQKTILNVNVPDLPLHALQGIRVTRLGSRHNAEPMIQSKDPRGRTIYWVGPAGKEADAGAGTDFYALKENCVSMTPIHLDMTHYELFDQMTVWNEKN